MPKLKTIAVALDNLYKPPEQEYENLFMKVSLNDENVYQEILQRNEDILGFLPKNARVNGKVVEKIVATFNKDPNYISLVLSDLIIRDREGMEYYYLNDQRRPHRETPIFVSGETKHMLNFTVGFDPVQVINMYAEKRLIVHIPEPLFIIEA